MSAEDTVQEEEVASWKKFFVLLAGKTNKAHRDFVKKFKYIHHTEVNSPEECDYILLFCPVASRVGTDVIEALDKIPAGKPTILVVMHHTFNTEHVVAESRRLVNNPDVHLTVDCLFYEDQFLKCNGNDIAWFEVQKSLKVSVSQVSAAQKYMNLIKSSRVPRDVSHEEGTRLCKRFFVFLAGTTNEAHYVIVEKLKRAGHTEVNSPEECDYILVFCPVASQVGTDVNEALDKIPAAKPTILVVMHQNFNPEHVIAESRRLVNNPDVHVTVDCLFYDGKLLDCTRNEAALLEIKNYLRIQQVSPKRNCLDSQKFWILLGGGLLLIILIICLIIFH